MRALLLGLLIAAAGAGQAKPDFSGTWKLLSRDGVAAKDSLVRTLAQKGEQLHYVLDREGVRQIDVDLTIGGPPHVSDQYGVIDAKWQGAVLVVDHLYNPGTPRELEQLEHWRLAEDGKRVLDDTVVRGAGRKEARMQRVFERQ